LEALGGVKPRGNAPPLWGVDADDADAPVHQKALKFSEVETLKQELGLLEARLPFVDLGDEQVSVNLEDVQITMESLKAELKQHEEERRPAAARKAQRLLDEATAQHADLFRENAIRHQAQVRASVLEQMSARKALAARTSALESWRVRLAELEADMNRDIRQGESEHFNVAPLREATEAISALEKAIASNRPPGEDELAVQRTKLVAGAPRQPGSWE